MEQIEFVWQLHDEKIVQAIQQAELRTSGEIRVFVSNDEVDDPVVAATQRFQSMGMTRTEQRNGVLVFVAPRSQRYAVVGDIGIHQKCGDAFWKKIAAQMHLQLRNNNPTRAIVGAIEEIGRLLGAHFPRGVGDVNELPDQVERG